jgi:drug/metabolite transporter (DMT)-like permease
MNQRGGGGGGMTGLSRQDAIGLALGFVGVVVFGGTLPFTRLAVETLDPWFVTAGRAALSGLLAAALLLVLRRRMPRGRTLTLLALVSFCLVGGFPIGTGLAMVTVEASRGGVILGVLPLATAAVGVVVSGERPPAKFWIAAVLGAALVVAFTLRDGVAGVSIGDSFLVLAIASAAVGYALSGQLARQMPGWEVISWALVVALPVTIPASLLLWPSDIAAVSVASWWGFFYVALFSQYLAFFAWNAGLALGGVARVSQVQLLQVFVTLGIAATLNRERVDALTWIAALVVVCVVLWGARARRA